MTIIYALLGGLLPALLWLSFWLSEDRKKPEPRRLILKTFFLGALAVILVLPFQKIAAQFFPIMGFSLFLIWAILEEVFKLVAAYFGGLKAREDDEPLDPLIYMITAALGFTALENALFVSTPFLSGDISTGLVTGGMRFIGASLLHTVSSAIIGLSLALTFYKRREKRRLALLFGILGATLIHAAFNLFLISFGSLSTFFTFGGVWAAAAILLLAFEKVKTVRPPVRLADEVSTLYPSPENHPLIK